MTQHLNDSLMITMNHFPRGCKEILSHTQILKLFKFKVWILGNGKNPLFRKNPGNYCHLGMKILNLCPRWPWFWFQFCEFWKILDIWRVSGRYFLPNIILFRHFSSFLDFILIISTEVVWKKVRVRPCVGEYRNIRKDSQTFKTTRILPQGYKRRPPHPSSHSLIQSLQKIPNIPKTKLKKLN